MRIQASSIPVTSTPFCSSAPIQHTSRPLVVSPATEVPPIRYVAALEKKSHAILRIVMKATLLPLAALFGWPVMPIYYAHKARTNPDPEGMVGAALALSIAPPGANILAVIEAKERIDSYMYSLSVNKHLTV